MRAYEIQPSLAGLILSSILTQHYVLGYFQTSPFDKLRAGSSGLSHSKSGSIQND